MNKETLKAIKDSAELVRQTMGFEYNTDGIEGIEAFIEKLSSKYAESDEEFKNAIVFRIGSFLGEAIIENIGGQWAEIDGNFAISFDADDSGDNAAFVFSKVLKRFEHGTKDSILEFYDLIPKMMKGDLIK